MVASLTYVGTATTLLRLGPVTVLTEPNVLRVPPRPVVACGAPVSSLPASDAELRATQRAQKKARESGGPVVEQATQAAAEMGANLEGSAQEAVDQVKGHAQDAAQTVKDEGTRRRRPSGTRPAPGRRPARPARRRARARRRP